MDLNLNRVRILHSKADSEESRDSKHGRIPCLPTKYPYFENIGRVTPAANASPRDSWPMQPYLAARPVFFFPESRSSHLIIIIPYLPVISAQCLNYIALAIRFKVPEAMQIACPVKIFLLQMRLGGDDYFQPCLADRAGSRVLPVGQCKRRGDREDLKQPVYQDPVRVLGPKYKICL